MTATAPEQPEFIRQQFAFAAYIRDPEAHPVPEGIEPRRIAMYRELFYNNIETFLAGSFPLLQQLLDEDHWQALVQDFFSRHHCQTPYFSEIPEEFLGYLQERGERPEDPPFLLELAHYEWVEMALAIAEGAPPASAESLLQNPLDYPLALSELAWPLAYRFPVQRLSSDYQPRQAPGQPTYLVVYRDAGDEVHFLEINAVTWRLLELIQERPEHSGRAHLQQIAAELQHPDPAAVIAGGHTILKDLAQRGLISRA